MHALCAIQFSSVYIIETEGEAISINKTQGNSTKFLEEYVLRFSFYSKFYLPVNKIQYDMNDKIYSLIRRCK